MKDLLTISALLAVSSIALAQVPNGSFEEWEVVNGKEEPVGWITTNEPCCLSSQKIFNAIDDGYAIKLSSTSWDFEGPGAGGAWVSFLPDHAYEYLHATVRVDTIDRARVNIYVREYSDGNYELIGLWEMDTTTNGAIDISIPINQSNLDSIGIELVANVTIVFFGTIGYSELIVDNLYFSPSPIPINEITVTLFPNPVGHELTLELEQAFRGEMDWNLYNELGQLVQSLELDSGQKRNYVQMEGLANGVYFYEIESAGVRMNSGKIIVQNP